jgi:hypothetical protein
MLKTSLVEVINTLPKQINTPVNFAKSNNHDDINSKKYRFQVVILMKTRKHKRIDLKSPIMVKGKIHKFKNKYGLNHTTLLKVENISLTGLRFSSALNFPVTNDLILSLEFSLLGRKNHLLGTIVWKRKTTTNYVYGFEIISSNIGYIQLVTFLAK